jgi:pyruvate/2-oxoglutarate dehydrogenase complex dihydrolipoamide dehydrogenase (E3) component
VTQHETQHTDVVVIGLGPGGETAASRLLEAGLDVVGIERELVGGECPYWGCVPSKMIIRAAGTVSEARRVDELAGTATVRTDYAPVARRIRTEATDTWDDTVAVERFEKLGGRFVRGSARIEAPGRVRVGDQVFAAARGVVLATGSRPVIPPLPGLDTVAFWTNREAITTEVAPSSLVVLGAGAIGLELAQALARFGSAVTVIEAAERVLPAEEPEVGDLLAGVLHAEGVDLRLGRRALEVIECADGVVVDLDDGTRVEGARLLVAVGRRPVLDGLGLEHYGIDPRGRAVPVDGRVRAADGLWAVGDVTGVGAFTHLAVYQAEAAAADILGRPGPGADYAALARVTFTDPEVGSVGLSEAAALARGLDVATGVAPVAASSRGFIHGPGNAGLVKLVADRATGALVGATAAGPSGGEVLSMLTLAVHAGIPVETLRRMHYAYPTFHRGVLDALAGLPVPLPEGR